MPADASLRGPARLASAEAFCLLSIAVIGLGNIWRFPGLVSANGGGVFVFVYLVALITVAAPLLIAEMKLGRIGQLDLFSSVRELGNNLQLSRAWLLMPVFCLLAAALLLSFYGVVAGWSLGYVVRAALGTSAGLNMAQSESLFLGLAGDAERSLAWHTIFWVIIAVISTHGLRRGLLRSARLFLPALVGLLGLLLLSVAAQHDLGFALGEVLLPDFSEFGWSSLLAAVSQACYTLSVGLGIGFMIGRSLAERVDVMQLCLRVVLADLLFSILMSVAVLAALDNAGEDISSGVRLLFVDLPAALAGSGLSQLLLFCIVGIVTAGSAMLLMEPLVAAMRAIRQTSRVFSAAAVAMLMWFAGLLSLASFTTWQAWRPFGRPLVEWLQYFAADLLIPINCLLLAAYVGRRIPQSLVAATSLNDMRHLAIWHQLLLYPARVAVLVMFVHVSGLAAVMIRFWS